VKGLPNAVCNDHLSCFFSSYPKGAILRKTLFFFFFAELDSNFLSKKCNFVWETNSMYIDYTPPTIEISSHTLPLTIISHPIELSNTTHNYHFTPNRTLKNPFLLTPLPLIDTHHTKPTPNHHYTLTISPFHQNILLIF